ncbi:hypothetical protein HY632_00265 [Candidatus Uhrbacteria bacterium]|nr:hypothetical protein [Candidatus Uhrbacteria bacterium]
MICTYCEQQVTRSDPNVVGGHGEYAHRSCIAEAERRVELESLHRRAYVATEEQQRALHHLREENAQLRARIRALETAAHDPPRDAHGDDTDNVRCSHGGRLSQLWPKG